MTRHTCLAILLLPLALAACTKKDSAHDDSRYKAELRWTSYGIPHVKANDWGSLGYGFAYAHATDGVCVYAKDVAMVNGELSAHLGPEAGNFESDVFHRAIVTDEKLRHFGGAQTDDMRAFSAGFVAGYNRYLEDHRGKLPASCNDAGWVRPITVADVARVTVSLGIRYGLAQFQKDMIRAAMPGETVAGGNTRFDRLQGIGSNAIAVGKAASESGRGILFGNPHYPWHGSSRFHMIHTTIPGVVDSMGAGLLASNFIGIGFNKDVAWTHTVSTALRFTIYQLQLDADNPMQYRYADGTRNIRPLTVDVPVRNDDGSTEVRQHTVYMTHYGPLIVSDQLPWNSTHAYAIRDAIIDNTAATATYMALNKATSVDDVEAALSLQGVYWTNTIAADREGNAFYADISGTPNVDKELLDACGVTVANIPSYVVVLDGSDPACEWKKDSRARVPGTLPAELMPRIKRDDYVTNSNDSYWLANPAAPLTGYSPIIGPERTERSLRTRAGLTLVREQLEKDGTLAPADVQQMLYSHRNFGAELLLDEILQVCEGDGVADIATTCDVLRQWDRRANTDSRGVAVWIEFWKLASGIDGLYSVPFDPDDPIDTPRGIATNNAAVANALRKAMRDAQTVLQDAGIALDAPWGEIQFARRNGDNIPIPGAPGSSGMFSYIISRLSKGEGYTPIITGNSYIQVVSWDKDGDLQSQGMLTYSQSPEPESAHFADLTKLYSRGEWIDFPFTEAEILADPNLKTLTLSGN
ncbi:MAG: penicillin acylase family protein [Gammaproteobacteria bacterium]|nr:penicillin acylase family protein [Gammaproteobacteria bacterium]